MIVRVAHHHYPNEERRAIAEVNGSKRVWPALASQPGAHAIYYGRCGDLEAYSISLWDGRALGEAAAAYMNSRPLLPGHTPDMLPTPDMVSFYEVVSALERDCVPAAGRMGYLHLATGVDSEAADTWGRTTFAPMLESVDGLCQAYLLRPEAAVPEGSGERIALTFWETPVAVEDGARAIGAWQSAQIAAGRVPAYVGTDAVALSDLLVGFVAAPSGGSVRNS